MVQIFVIKDTGIFLSNPVFKGYSGRISDSSCVVLPSKDGLDDLIARGIVEEVSVPPYSEDERAAFIQDYTAFIASLNSRYKDKFLWWCTDLSSKNTYLCLLPELIQELLDIEKGLEACRDKPLLLVSPSVGIYKAVQPLMVKYGRKLLWPGACKKTVLQGVRGAAASFLRLLVRALRFYARSLWARVAMRQYARRKLTPKKDFYVVKTFSYPNSWDINGEYKDTFFGGLPRYLSTDNNVLVLSYHLQGFREFVRRASLEKTLAILPVELFLKGGDVFRAVVRILTFRVPITSKMYFRGLDVSDVLRFELFRTMNGIQVFQLLHYDAVRNMLKQLRAHTFLYTFENNPWERMCVMACRQHSPSTRVIGYQHSVVPQAALNMFIYPLEKNIVPLPDRVLTTGEISKSIMEQYGDYSSVSVRSACALRYEYLGSVKLEPRRKSQGSVLLVLDGVGQTLSMLEFALKQLEGHPHYRLRVRCHPMLPWELLSRKFHIDVNNHENVEISGNMLQEDLLWSDMIIYWQSAVVLEAMSMGKPAINFKSKEILSYDPLYRSEALKWTVTEDKNLLDTIAAIEDLDEISYQKQLVDALAYIKRYFYPESQQALGLFKA